MGNINQSDLIRKHHKSRNPLLYWNCLHNGYAKNTVFSKVKSFKWYNCAQSSLEKNTNYHVGYGIDT